LTQLTKLVLSYNMGFSGKNIYTLIPSFFLS
jgi:hypothetical protein